MILGDLETTRFKHVTRELLALMPKTTMTNVELDFNIQKNLHSIGYVEKIIVVIKNDYIQVALMKKNLGDFKMVLSLFVKDTDEFKNGTLMILVETASVINLIANITRILAQMVVESKGFAFKPIHTVQIRCVDQLTADMLFSVTEMFVRALQRRQVFAKTVTVTDMERDISREFVHRSTNSYTQQSQIGGGSSIRRRSRGKPKKIHSN
jgi:hypothetical protein